MSPQPFITSCETSSNPVLLESLQDRNVFDSKYFDFVWNLIHLIKPSEKPLDAKPPKGYDLELHVIQFATCFLYYVYTHAKDKPALKIWIYKLQELYAKNLTVRILPLS